MPFNALVFTLRNKVELNWTRAIRPVIAQSVQFSKIAKKLVVIRMGSLKQQNLNSGAIRNNSKIPEYARDYKNEWLFIRGINKTCGCL